MLPAYVGLSTGVVTAEQISPFTLPWLLTTVDVHHMAGLSLVCIALLGLVARPGWSWLLLGAVVVLLAPIVRGTTFGTSLLDGPLTPVLSDAPNVYYAVLPWIAYPLAGGVFGAIIARAKDRTLVFRRGAALGLGLAIVAAALFAISPPVFDIDTYWDEPPAFVVGILGFVLMWLAVCDLVVRHVRANRIFDFLYGWSARVIAIYFTHWLVVGWGVGIFGFRAQPIEGALLGIVVAIVATALLSRFAVGLETPQWLERWASQRSPRAQDARDVLDARDALDAPDALARIGLQQVVRHSAAVRCIPRPDDGLCHTRASPRSSRLMRSHAIRIAALLVAITFAGCSSPAATAGPGGATNPPPVATDAGQATGPLLAGEACSYLTAAEVGAIVGTVPVLVEERAGRGDCDYFLNAAGDAKVNIGLYRVGGGRRIGVRVDQGLRRPGDDRPR